MSEKIRQMDTDVIYESIITTYNEDQTVNAAVMGISLTLSDVWIIKPFKETDTQRNIQRNNELVVNFTLNPEMYVLCSLFQEELTDDLFFQSPDVNAPILKECEKDYCALRVVSIDEEGDSLRVIYQCKLIKNINETSKPFIFTRAFSSLIEILIHSTRILAFKNQPEKLEEVKHLNELINHHSGIIIRVTQNESYYRKILSKIIRKVNPEG
ncbi:MAG: DUF447 family protein [Candidatus Heimdallarchaeota archaeon]|nr:DUF447 family protein [Candidatus Heimdallarchaeota archaeon]